MGTPSKIDASTIELSDEIAKLLPEVEVTEEGKLDLPGDLDPKLKAAALSEYRRRSTQSAYTKSQQELIALQAKNKVLEELTKPQIELDEKTASELEELKFSDPDKWRSRMNLLEIEARRKQSSLLTEAEKKAQYEAALANRKKYLEEHNRRYPDLAITEDTIKYDIPPRLTSKLEKGEITFEDFVQQASKFLATPKVVGDGNDILDQPNLTKVGGDFKPSNSSVKKDIVQSYKDMIL